MPLNSYLGLCDLPVEILAHILSFCKNIDICNVSLVCKTLHDAASFPSLWISKMRTEYRSHHIDTDKWTHRDVYQNLLYKYGHTIGLWQRKQSCYGALIKVIYDPIDACIKAFDVLPPRSPHVHEPVRKKMLFKICMKKETEPRQIHCCYNYKHGHSGTVVKLTPGNDSHETGFHFHCEYDEVGHMDIYSPGTNFSQWINDEFSEAEQVVEEEDDEDQEGLADFDLLQRNRTRNLRLRKWIATCRRGLDLIANPFEMKDLKTPSSSQMIIQPGIFKGTYSLHGVEFVKLTYESDEKIVVVKITGDENVPAGEITNTADLTRPMILNRYQQLTEAALLNIDTPNMQPGFDIKLLPKQVFIVPRSWRSPQLDLSKFDKCRARFHGEGQIAAAGFCNPQFTKGHWILFDEDTFGFIWLELRAFALYVRVKEGEI